jgi:hypothetical protein
MDIKSRRTEKKGEKIRGNEIRNNVNPAIKYRKLIPYCINNVLWFTSSTRPVHLLRLHYPNSTVHTILYTKDGSHHVFILSKHWAFFLYYTGWATDNWSRTCHHVVWQTSSSFCRAPVANALDVLQPCWLTVLPLDIPTLTTSHLHKRSSQTEVELYIDLFWCSNFHH